MPQTTDVAIIGAGVTGCSIAYHLSLAGVRVVVLERAEIAAEASSAAAGLLSPQTNLHGPGAYTDLLTAGWVQNTELVPKLEEASGVQVGYHRLGMLGSVSLLPAPNDADASPLRVRAWKGITTKNCVFVISIVPDSKVCPEHAPPLV